MNNNIRTESIVVMVSKEELKQIDKAWKAEEDVMNRSQFVRTVIKDYISANTRTT